jgi:hypothetical protein
MTQKPLTEQEIVERLERCNEKQRAVYTRGQIGRTLLIHLDKPEIAFIKWLQKASDAMSYSTNHNIENPLLPFYDTDVPDPLFYYALKKEIDTYRQAKKERKEKLKAEKQAAKALERANNPPQPPPEQIQPQPKPQIQKNSLPRATASGAKRRIVGPSISN